MNNRTYNQGYAAGRNYNKRRIQELERQLAEQPSREERLLMQSLDLALKHCRGWSVGGQTINNAEGYVRLAKIFADNAIEQL